MASTLAFEIAQVRRQRVRWPAAGFVLAAAVISGCVLAGPVLAPATQALLFGAAMLVAGSGWQAGRCRECGTLMVDSGGLAHWLPAGQQDREQASPLLLQRWQLGMDEIWICAKGPNGARIELRIHRPLCDDHHWRALRRWLVWVARGMSTHPGMAATGRPQLV